MSGEWKLASCVFLFSIPFFILIMFTLCSRLLFQELLKDVVLYIFFMRTINFIDSNFIALALEYNYSNGSIILSR